MNVINPKYGFYFTLSDIANAKKNINNFEWAGKSYDKLKQLCDSFITYSDDEIYGCVLSMKDQTFAYGISGCPHCRKPFPMNNEEQRPMFSDIRDVPLKKITCPDCGTVFPNDSYKDNGNGFQVDGKAYYLIGMWNFFHAGDLLGGVRDHEGMVTKLTYMYMLTGDKSYAHKALVILDAFSAIYPGTIGPRDFTPFGSQLDLGRLHLLTSIVFRVKVCLATDYDWLYNMEELNEQSPALLALGKQGTIRHNIEAMLNEYLLTEPNGTNFDLNDGNLTHLQNHESDGVRAMLAVGLVLDNLDYLRWGINAVEAYFYNTLGRDGMYYEGSFGYSLFTGTVFLDIALLALRASSIHKLDSVETFDCSRFFKYSVKIPVEMLCQGHLPCYGDWGRDTSVGSEPDRKMLLDIYRAALYFYQFSESEAVKSYAEKTMNEIYPIVKEQLGSKGIDLFFSHSNGNEIGAFHLPKCNTLSGHSGICILRAKNDDTVLMRVGKNNTHSHDDVLAYSYYSHRKEISADIGYGIYGTNAHYGWTSKAIAHNTVIVNEDENIKKGQLYKPFSGGEFSFIYESEHLNVMEGSAPRLYNLDSYQRMLGTVSIDDNASYIIDFFYIDGAKTTDFAYHAFHESSRLIMENAEKVISDHWALAGVDSEEKLYIDTPGKSFGERLTTGETFTELLSDEQGNLWTPDKNNGYGYIYNINEYKGKDNFFKAKWLSEQGYELSLTGLYEEGDRLFTGVYPNLNGSDRNPMLIQRSYKKQKVYASIVQTRHCEADIQSVSDIKQVQAEGSCVTAISVSMTTGYTDYWVYSNVKQNMIVGTHFGEWSVNGRCGWIRLDGRGVLLESACVNADYMVYKGMLIEGRSTKWSRILNTDIKNSCILVDTEMPGYAPKYVFIRESECKIKLLYPVESIKAQGNKVQVNLKDSLVLSKGIVKKQGDSYIESMYPLPLGANNPSPFIGKRMIGEYGGLAIIKDIEALKIISVKNVYVFRPGERFDIIDIEKGYEILM